MKGFSFFILSLCKQISAKTDLYQTLIIFCNRTEDIPLLISSFIRRLNITTGKNISGVSRDAMEAIMDYHWPGNIRELKNAMEYSFVTTEGSAIQPEHLPKQISTFKRRAPSSIKTETNGKILPDEKAQLIQALKQTNGNQSKAARRLNINRVTVWNRMKKYKIDLKKVLSV
ncbi:MAG: hypothetical protein HUK40_12250 [Desulfobacter sp.]|nr:hypothetical protein [Desulfobacter sp.]